jgi:perosamine synthetase
MLASSVVTLPAPSPDARQRLFIPSLPTLDPLQLLPSLEPRRPHLYPLDQLHAHSAQLFYLARAGVYHTIKHWLGRAPTERDVVLMPAYHHGVEVEAVRAAGGRVVFYRVDRELCIDLDDLAAKAARPDVRVVYVTHYAGFAQPIAAAQKIARAHPGVRLFEDCALSLFARTAEGIPLGSFGDASCFCLYKSLPLPHGGLLLAPDVPVATVSSPPLLSTLHHVAGLTLAHLELHSSGIGRAVRQAARATSQATVDKAVATVKTGTMHLTEAELHLGASALVQALLPRFDDQMVVVRRRRNFARLAAALEDVLEVVYNPLPAGACPLFLPVRIDTARGRDKAALVAQLNASGIDAIDFWSSSDPACDPAEFPEAARLRREILELPCHQSLDDDAIDRVAHAVKQVLAHA